jgi:hypothetical protein
MWLRLELNGRHFWGLELDPPEDTCPLDVNGLGPCHGAQCPSGVCRDAAVAHFECLRIAAAAQDKAEELAPVPLASTPPQQRHTPRSPMMGMSSIERLSATRNTSTRSPGFGSASSVADSVKDTVQVFWRNDDGVFDLVKFTNHVTNAELWGTRYETIEDRFPGLSVSELWAVVEQNYVTETAFRIWNVDNDNKQHRVAYRHRLNPRKQASAVLKYAELFLKEGLFIRARGALVFVEGEQMSMGAPAHIEMVSGGTIVDAIVHAHSIDPQNRHVKRFMVEHIPALRINSKAGDDIIMWVKNSMNDYHMGGQFSPIELLEETYGVSTQGSQPKWADGPRCGPTSFPKLPTSWEPFGTLS